MKGQAKHSMRLLEEVSLLLALFLFDLPGVSWKQNTVHRKQSKRFPNCVKQNFLTQLVREGALLGFLCKQRRTCGWGGELGPTVAPSDTSPHCWAAKRKKQKLHLERAWEYSPKLLIKGLIPEMRTISCMYPSPSLNSKLTSSSSTIPGWNFSTTCWAAGHGSVLGCKLLCWEGLSRELTSSLC